MNEVLFKYKIINRVKLAQILQRMENVVITE